jgi:hypothetical protein
MEDARSLTPVQEFENLVRSADPARLQEAFCPNFDLNYEVVADLNECVPDREVIFLEPLSETPNSVVRILDKRKEHRTDVRRRQGGCYNKPTLIQWLATEKLKYRGDDFEVTDPATRDKVCWIHTREEALRELARDDEAFRARLQDADQRAYEYDEHILRLQVFRLQIAEELVAYIEQQREIQAMIIEEQSVNLHETRELLLEYRQRYGQLSNLRARTEVLNATRNRIDRLERLETRVLTLIGEAKDIINIINEEIARRHELERNEEAVSRRRSHEDDDGDAADGPPRRVRQRLP